MNFHYSSAFSFLLTVKAGEFQNLSCGDDEDVWCCSNAPLILFSTEAKVGGPQLLKRLLNSPIARAVKGTSDVALTHKVMIKADM